MRAAFIATCLLQATAVHALPLASQHRFGDDLETVRLAALALFCWPADIQSTVATALTLSTSLNATGYWSDIRYNDLHDRANWDTLNHLSRVTTMVQALATPGSSVFEQPALSSKAHLALGVWLEHRWTNDNWWYQWIGVPLQVGEIFLLLGENRTSPSEQSGLSSLNLEAAWWVNAWGGGANLVWMIQAELYRGLATRNDTAVSQGFSTMWADVTVKSPSRLQEGVQPDGAYWFHGAQPMNFAYGADWLSAVLNFHEAAVGTHYDLPPAQIDVLASFMAEGNAHMSWGTYYDFVLQGRGVDRPGGSYNVPTSPASVRRVAAATSSASLRAELNSWADRLAGVPGTPPLLGARYYWTSDFGTVHRATWGASIKGHGNNSLWRVIASECDNSEDILAEHASDGLLNVYGDLATAGSEYVAPPGNPNSIFPLWDWQGLNGITVEHSVPLEKCGAGDEWPVIDTAFVGAACDGQALAFAMDTATHSLTAARSWLFFDGAIIALAARITDSARVNVRTALASRLLPLAPTGAGAVAIGFANGTSVAALADGAYSWPATAVSWAAAGGNVYVPAVLGGAGADAALLGLSVGTVTGNWSTIGAYSGKSTGRLLAANLDHSGGGASGAANAAYAYAIVPAVAPADAAAAAASLSGVDRACIVNTAAVQGAAHPAAGLVQVVFWSAATYACTSTAVPGWAMSVASAGPVIVLVREAADGSVTVTAEHPFAAAGSAAITVSRTLSGAACAPAGAGRTAFSIAWPANPDFRGASVNATCAKA